LRELGILSSPHARNRMSFVSFRCRKKRSRQNVAEIAIPKANKSRRTVLVVLTPNSVVFRQRKTGITMPESQISQYMQRA
jgi:hypothetical protein